jgi:hypothetical protein
MDVAAAGADQPRRNAAVPKPDVQGLIFKPCPQTKKDQLSLAQYRD